MDLYPQYTNMSSPFGWSPAAASILSPIVFAELLPLSLSMTPSPPPALPPPVFPPPVESEESEVHMQVMHLGGGTSFIQRVIDNEPVSTDLINCNGVILKVTVTKVTVEVGIERFETIHITNHSVVEGEVEIDHEGKVIHPTPLFLSEIDPVTHHMNEDVKNVKPVTIVNDDEHEAPQKGRRGRKPRIIVKREEQQEKEDIRPCPNCSKPFKDVGSWRRHVKTHEDGKYPCKDDPQNCTATYRNVTSLTKHRQQAHGFKVARDQSKAAKERKMLEGVVKVRRIKKEDNTQ